MEVLWTLGVVFHSSYSDIMSYKIQSSFLNLQLLYTISWVFIIQTVDQLSKQS